MEKEWQKRNSKLNTYSALVMHSYFNFDRKICEVKFSIQSKMATKMGAISDDITN